MAQEQAAATAADTTIAGDGSVPATNWGWFLLRGILALVLGVITLFFPVSALFAFTLLFAAYAFADGIASLIAGVRGAREGERWGMMVLRGIAGVAVGILFVVMPLIATYTYAYLTIALLAAWAILGGMLDIWAAFRLHREIKGEWLLGIAGLVSILLGIGVLVLVMPLPAATILSAAWLIAMFAFVSGIVLIVQAFRLKKLAPASR